LHAAGVYGYRSLLAFGPALIYLVYQLWRMAQAGDAPWTRLHASLAQRDWRRDWRAALAAPAAWIRHNEVK
jgi:hypothetical protein